MKKGSKLIDLSLVAITQIVIGIAVAGCRSAGPLTSAGSGGPYTFREKTGRANASPAG
jgi:hypothetical protein